MNAIRGLGVALMILLWLAGCAPRTRTDVYPLGSPEPPAGAESRRVDTVQDAERSRSVDGAQGTDPSLPAVVALANGAREAREQGDLDRAAADLERALRLDPDNAALWHQLAQVRVDQLRMDQAETLALKSNQFAGDDVALQRANWNLIARARRLRGDEAGAQAAFNRARDLASE